MAKNETQDKMRAKADELERKAVQLESQAKKTPMELACVLTDIKKGEMWKYMTKPHADVDSWLDAKSIARSTFYRGTRIVGLLDTAGVKRAEIKKMTLANAEWLGKLKEAKQITNSRMIEKAQTMKEESFASEVQDTQRENGDDVSDGKVVWKIRLEKATADFVDETIAKFEEKHNLEPELRARNFEMAIAELRTTIDGNSVVVPLSTAVTKVGFELGQTRSHDDSDMSVEDQLEALKKVRDECIIAIADATKGFGVKHPPRPKAATASVGRVQ